MWFREVEVPDELVEAATEGKLVLFVGAPPGASLDEPSGLPDFNNPGRDVGARANRVPTDRDLERPDVFLGDLADLESYMAQRRAEGVTAHRVRTELGCGGMVTMRLLGEVDDA